MFQVVTRTFASLKHRNYRLFAIGGLISNLGTWLQRIAQDWMVLQLTNNSGLALGITMALQFLPTLLLSPLAGLMADRFNKRRLLQCTAAWLAVPAGVLGVLAVLGVAEVWHVYLLTFIFGIGSAFDIPARQAFISELVEPRLLTNAVGLNSLSMNSARMIGPAIAGVMIDVLGGGVAASGWVILLNAISFAGPIVMLQLLDTATMSTPTPIARAKGQVREGVSYLRTRPDVLLVFVIVFFAGTFGLTFQVTSALMATEEYHKGAGEFGLLGTCLAIGSFSGALLAASRVYITQRLVVVTSACFGVALVIAGFMPSFTSFALWSPVVGFFSLTLITACNSSVQLAVDPQYRGRVMALYMMVLLGGTPLGSPLIGWVGEAFGPRWTMWVAGGFTVFGVGLALMLFARPARELRAAGLAPAEAP